MNKKILLMVAAIGGLVFFLTRKAGASPVQKAKAPVSTTGSASQPLQTVATDALLRALNAKNAQSKSNGGTNLVSAVLPSAVTGLFTLAGKTFGSGSTSSAKAAAASTTGNSPFYGSGDGNSGDIAEGGNDPRLFNSPQTADYSGDPEGDAAAYDATDYSGDYTE